jgi:hypothetical protein
MLSIAGKEKGELQYHLGLNVKSLFRKSRINPKTIVFRYGYNNVISCKKRRTCVKMLDAR